MATSQMEQKKKSHLALIMVVYLFGIFMGAIDTGIVTPARTVIQSHLMVDEKTGIWMITIYTLAYAASIPVMGKLADRFGRKIIYLLSIFLFGFGSLLCGLSSSFSSFTMLLIARTIQAIGGGGIMPVATAEFGTTFPEEKRGMALGLIGGVYGIANIFGSSAGSAILDAFGTDNWKYIFYINIPITIFILIVGALVLVNNKTEEVKKIDKSGVFFIVVMVLSLLYGLRNIDFFDFKTTFLSTKVYPYLIVFLLLLPIFIWVEKRAEDPVINLKYFTNNKIIITLIISFITGFVMMGMIFVPQFCENALKVSTGKGGYFVIILGLFAGISAPLSGNLIDKLGSKIVLGTGFIISILGAGFLILVTTNYPSTLTVMVSLVLIGLGIGFTMGTPLNYMMLENTQVEEANSALATLSLVRSIGTALAPAIMIGFLANAGSNVQGNIMNILPTTVNVPELPYSKELTDEFTALKSNPNMKDKLADITFPDLTGMTTIKIDPTANSNQTLPSYLLEELQNADVTTITQSVKDLSTYMFSQMTPSIKSNITDGIDKGITGVQGGIESIEKTIKEMQQGQSGIDTAIAQLQGSLVQMPPAAQIPIKAQIEEMQKKKESLSQGLTQVTEAKKSMETMITQMNTLKEAVPATFETANNNYLSEIDKKEGEIQKVFQDTLNVGFKEIYLTSGISAFIALGILAFYKSSKKKTA